ncbi:MAG TPA: hypothetical protein VF384_13055 [Planctomycetota bacterium]
MDHEPGSAPTPVCPGCLAPIERARYYCKRCGRDTGQFTSYLPFVNIPWMATGFGTAWQKVWQSNGPRWYARVGYMLFIVLFAPVMLVGLPFVLLARRGEASQRRA